MFSRRSTTENEILRSELLPYAIYIKKNLRLGQTLPDILTDLAESDPTTQVKRYLQEALEHKLSPDRFEQILWDIAGRTEYPSVEDFFAHLAEGVEIDDPQALAWNFEQFYDVRLEILQERAKLEREMRGAHRSFAAIGLGLLVLPLILLLVVRRLTRKTSKRR